VDGRILLVEGDPMIPEATAIGLAAGRPPGHRRPGTGSLPTLLTLLAGVLLAACSPGTGDLGPVATPAPTPGDSIPAPSAEPTPLRTLVAPASPAGSPTPPTTVRAYFFLGSFTGNAGLVPVLREVAATKAVGTAAIQSLLAGPNDTELGASPAMYTDIPNGTRLLGLAIENGLAIVTVSKEFDAGGDVATVRGREAQIVFTLTQFPTIVQVQIRTEGSLPPSHQDPSVGRADFTDQLPAIWVDGPEWRGVLGNPGRVTGFANVFEAQFRVEILDAGGQPLLDVPVTATCGTGCWGTFAVTLQYVTPSAGWGTLRVYDRSANDGSNEHVVDYPVWLTP